jgi:pyruvate/2-oxoglutarate dehydrogenase complex dihydrolipoamide acyltransferase (E2) component
MFFSRRVIPKFLKLQTFQFRKTNKFSSTSTTNDPNIISMKLADIGEGIQEVELLRWYIKPGDQVKIFDQLCEVQSDKATVEITSRYDGVVKSLLHQEGAIVKVGDILIDIEKINNTSPVPTSSSSSSSLLSSSSSYDNITSTNLTPTIANLDDNSNKNWNESLSISQQTLQNETIEITNRNANTSHKILASPAVRKLAKDYEIDLRHVIGTGSENHILKDDILKIIDTKDKNDISSPAGFTDTAAAQQEQEQYHNLKTSTPPIATTATASDDKKVWMSKRTDVITPLSPTSSPPPPPTPTRVTLKNASDRSGRITNNNTVGKIVPIRGIRRIMVNSMTAALQVIELTFYFIDIKYIYTVIHG